jgi:pseudaminic acid cytidylyltransferase
VIAIIPARGGSKRILRKNIKLFYSKPMIVWSIENAKSSKLFDAIVVSTDDEEIASIASSCGATVPFRRPAELSDDYTTSKAVVSHAIAALGILGLKPEYVCCIYPCTPFLRQQDLIDGLKLLQSSRAGFSYAVSEYSHPIQRALTRQADGKMHFLHSEYELSRTQDLMKAYYDLGQFYWGGRDAWLGDRQLHEGGAGLVLPTWRFVDIDNLDDWKRAEMIFRTLRRYRSQID